MNVKEILEEQGMTRYTLVEKMGSSYDVINNIFYERSISIRLSTIEKLCDILNCSPNRLFTKVDTDGNIIEWDKTEKDA